MTNLRDLPFCEKFRPTTISECILPESIKATFQSYVDKQEIHNLIFAGSSGLGKTSAALALVKQLDCDYIMLNGSNETGIDVLRSKVAGYATSMSLDGRKKVVIFDEAEKLGGALQAALRGAIEEYAGVCAFIFTCNTPNQIIPALHSRCAVVSFSIPDTEKPKLAGQFLKRVEGILKSENIEYNRKAVIELIKKFFPDFRRTLNELQRYGISGKIDEGILANLSETSVDEVLGYLKDKNFRDMRKWVGEHAFEDDVKIMRQVLDRIAEVVKPEYVPLVTVKTADYMYRSSFMSDKEIGLAAYFADLMIEAEML